MKINISQDKNISIVDAALITGAAVGVPLALAWILKNPVNNIKTSITLLNAVRNVAAMLH